MRELADIASRYLPAEKGTAVDPTYNFTDPLEMDYFAIDPRDTAAVRRRVLDLATPLATTPETIAEPQRYEAEIARLLANTPAMNSLAANYEKSCENMTGYLHAMTATVSNRPYTYVTYHENFNFEEHTRLTELVVLVQQRLLEQKPTRRHRLPLEKKRPHRPQVERFSQKGTEP